jgi:hypothetical protein
MGPHFCARSSFNQHRNEGVVSEQTRRKGDIVTNSKEALVHVRKVDARAASRSPGGRRGDPVRGERGSSPLQKRAQS